MVVTTFLRRTNGAVDEYLFIPVETMEPLYGSRVIAPNLPGKTSADLKGDGSANFLLDLVMYQITLSIGGFLVPMVSGEFPSLNGTTQKYITPAGISSTPPASISGKQLRTLLYDFAANQNVTTYTDFKFGWPEWGATDDTVIVGVSYRLWEGFIREIQTREFAGELDQYFYSIGFVVGDT